MTVREAEDDAGRLLAASWWDSPWEDSPLPIEPVQIAQGLGIAVHYVRLPLDESGNITISASGSEIMLNVSDSINRRRFTCAHEIGHYYSRLQEGKLDQGHVFVDRRAQLAAAGLDVEEIYANQFAAALLMPARLVQQGYRQHKRPVDDLARHFGTSSQAMTLRLRNLNLA